MGESKKTAHEGIHPVRGHIDPILRDCLERGIGRRDGMPVQLRVHATRPLNDCILTDRIIEGGDQDVCTSCRGSADRFVHVFDQIACTLRAEWIRDRRLEAENGYRAHGCKDQLRYSAALGWSYCEDSLLGRCAAKCRNQTRDEAIKIFRSHVDMCCVVLRPDSHARSSGWLRSLGKSSDVRKS